MNNQELARRIIRFLGSAPQGSTNEDRLAYELGRFLDRSGATELETLTTRLQDAREARDILKSERNATLTVNLNHWMGAHRLEGTGLVTGIQQMSASEIVALHSRFSVMLQPRDSEMILWLDDKGRRFTQR